MLLAIDIGNSNIVFGVFKNNELSLTFRFETKHPSYKKSILSFLKINRLKKDLIKNIIISSVVPEASERLQKDIYNIFHIKPLVLGKNVLVPIKNLYKKPKEVGQDRLVNSFAAKTLYGTPSITIDLGTAITFDVISKKGEYLGGLIFPGLELSMEALSLKAALLPRITLRKPKNLVGKETAESMRSGIYYGIGSLCDGIIEKLNNKFNTRFKVIATGGHSREIANFCELIDKVDMDLTLKGLNLIFNEIYQNN